ncbi:MAG: endonuclease VIII [Methanomassiliicoccus sp.]|nr:endonuclease VIII [Methanomassiliicoccus sp.]
MIELPEAHCIAGQISSTVAGKRIANVIGGHTPHKLAWYYGDLSKYPDLLVGKTVLKAEAYGGLVEIKASKSNILFGEGINMRFHGVGDSRPQKHQLLLEFKDGTALSASVQMYGGVGAFAEGELDNPYYRVAKEKPSPLTDAFDMDHFQRIVSAPDAQKGSLKALLATEQRVPGLGNGVLQDILLNSRMHPKRKVNTMNSGDVERLFWSVKNTLGKMMEQGGRDTELDLFGHPGGYRTILSKKTVNKPCPVCGTLIKKEAYMGGSIYYCEGCQKI